MFERLLCTTGSLFLLVDIVYRGFPLIKFTLRYGTKLMIGYISFFFHSMSSLPLSAVLAQQTKFLII